MPRRTATPSCSVTATSTQAYAFNQKRPYDALKDLIPVARICDLPMLYLTADTSVNTLAEEIAR
jgi:tripartite-type tricarboxylate transporter receptor subunit TctC